MIKILKVSKFWNCFPFDNCALLANLLILNGWILTLYSFNFHFLLYGLVNFQIRKVSHSKISLFEISTLIKNFKDSKFRTSKNSSQRCANTPNTASIGAFFFIYHLLIRIPSNVKQCLAPFISQQFKYLHKRFIALRMFNRTMLLTLVTTW